MIIKKHTLTSLIYEIDRQLSGEEDIELALILEELSEYHYYKEVRKSGTKSTDLTNKKSLCYDNQRPL